MVKLVRPPTFHLFSRAKGDEVRSGRTQEKTQREGDTEHGAPRIRIRSPRRGWCIGSRACKGSARRGREEPGARSGRLRHNPR